MNFGSSGYTSPMDREYHQSPPERDTQDVKLSIGEIGTSIALGPTPNIPALAGKLRMGIKKVELGFMGAGKGSGQGHTPEMYGKLQRQALRELQQANRVDFTTHATVGVYGVAGMDQQGNFSKTSKNSSVNEIRRAIDFAADVSRGGPVVVHTGEFQRPFTGAEWNDGDYKNRFKAYKEEDERTTYRVIDTRTGGAQLEVRKNQKIPRPIWKTVRPGERYKDAQGQERVAQREVYVGYYDKEIPQEVAFEDRVPVFNEKKNEFEIRLMEWKDLEKEAEELTSRARDYFQKWKRKEVSDADFSNSMWQRFARVKDIHDVKIRPEEAYIINSLETQAATSRGWAYYSSADFKQHITDLEKLQKARSLYEEIEKGVPKEEEWSIKRKVESLVGSDFVPPDYKKPTEIIDQRILQLKGQIARAQEGAASQWSQAEQYKDQMKYVESSETYAISEACDAYAVAGIYALKQTERLQQEKDLKKPIAIAMENLFPETYGAHPAELKKLVLQSRERMAEMLVENQGYKKEEAMKKAQDHITGTFDIGHLNMWRKFWQADPQKSIKENEKEFDKWVLEQVEDLAQSGVVGHLHLVDNYGYQDDHLAPGEGNAPIQQVMNIFKKHNFKGDIVVEPGADFTTDTSGFNTILKTWKMFGSEVYGAGGQMGQKRGWGYVGNAYFGQGHPPYFVFGSYSPSEDWTLWSGTPLE